MTTIQLKSIASPPRMQRAAIAKALVEYTQNDKLKNAYIKYDRMLLVDDTRRVEPKKPLGTKARKKKQKSKR